MKFHHFDMLRNAVRLARFCNLSDAAEAMHITKGALSQQIKRLEEDLGFAIFERHTRGMRPTRAGRELLAVAHQSLGQIEEAITTLRAGKDQVLTIGTTTYFASRWLSPRLMDFMQMHPEIRLRIEPMANPQDFQREGIDLTIRWGDGSWSDGPVVPLLSCPAWPTGNTHAYERVEKYGALKAFEDFTLLHDHEDGRAWQEWYAQAELSHNSKGDTLIIPDPNVRVQAVIDGQGIALNDALIASEIARGQLYRLHPLELTNYGYFLAFQDQVAQRKEVAAFIDWIQAAA